MADTAVGLAAVPRGQRTSLRKVVSYYFLSLDGVAESPDQFLTTWDDETDANAADVIALQDTIVLGRRTYDEWVQFWPSSEIEPFASFVNAVPKYVATSSPLTARWDQATAIEGGLAKFVERLKEKPGGEIGVHGSISITRHLLDAGLVDELKLVVAPVLAGGGRRLLTGLAPRQLDLLRCSTSTEGNLLIDYAVNQ